MNVKTLISILEGMPPDLIVAHQTGEDPQACLKVKSAHVAVVNNFFGAFGKDKPDQTKAVVLR